MASAFTAQEREAIIVHLKEAAIRQACMVGIKKTTIDDLTRSAGISKSAFYVFYESKEHLFQEVRVDWYRHMFTRAKALLAQHAELPMRQRVFEAMWDACQVMIQSNMVDFADEDIGFLQRKLPPELMNACKQENRRYVEELMQSMGLSLRISSECAITVVRILVGTLRFRREIGEEFDDALRAVVQSCCEQLIGE